MSLEEPPSDDSDNLSLVELFTSFTPIAEFPLPQSQDAVNEFVDGHPQFEMTNNDDPSEEITPDDLYCDYMNIISQNQEWMVFKIELYGYGDSVYVWNREMGEGIRIPTNEWQFGTFAEVLSLARDADDEWKSTNDPAEPVEDGCPYCDGGEMSSSLRQSGSYKQRCNECGRFRIVG